VERVPFVGQPIPRLEDDRLVRGHGQFVDDLAFPDTLEAAFVRSPHAHARILAIDAAAARAVPGVTAIFTLADLSPLLRNERLPLQFRNSQLPLNITPYVLAKTEVAFVGEIVAIVIAESRYVAEDAVTLVDVTYEPLPVVADCAKALEPGAPLVHLERPNNLIAEFTQAYGDIAGAFAQAPHQATLRLKQHRGGAHPIEGRGVVAVIDETENRLTVWTSTQLVHEARAFLMTLLGLDENQLRVVAPDVGGGFGAKFVLYPEEVAVAVSCLRLRRPIKWIEDRREHFLAAIQERDQYWQIEVAFEDDGTLLGIRGSLIHDQGAYTLQGVNLPFNASSAVPGPYVLPAYELRVYVAETNKVPTIPVRGAGYPEGTFAMERALDRIAQALQFDRAEVRRRNLVPASKMPYTVPLRTRGESLIVLDSGDYPRCQRQALDAINYSTFRERQRRAHSEGRFLGIGVANGVKGTGRGPFECAIVRIGRSGQVSVYTAAMCMGQGIKTALAQICPDQLGLRPDDIAVVTGDTAVISHGFGGFASRQTVTAGSAVHLAAIAVREKAVLIASHILRTPVQGLEVRGGRIYKRTLPTEGLTLRELAEAMSGVPGYALPADFEPALESLQYFKPTGLAYSMASHAVEVEVDIATCNVRIVRYVAVNDAGRIINPMIAEGQIIGGIAHGIGNALFEWMGYDEQAQPITTTFGDYLLPGAMEVPVIETFFHESVSPLNPLGVKGVGELGCVPAAAAILSAVEDALASFHIHITETPLTPNRLFALMFGDQPAVLQSGQSPSRT
jgi:carbon-monoxide dehydrogenase large subunit